jgi:hypothetical protein
MRIANAKDIAPVIINVVLNVGATTGQGHRTINSVILAWIRPSTKHAIKKTAIVILAGACVIKEFALVIIQAIVCTMKL